LRFDLQETPSLLLASRTDASHLKGGRPLIVGAPLASEEAGLLPEVLEEVKDIARFGNNPTVLVSDEATEAGVIAHLSSATSIHFAGHAIQQDGSARLLLSPSATASSFAPATYLDSALLRKYPPRAARLAVLSACSTGKRNEGWDHGVGDIVDTLASLHVPEVVATRWQIDSAAAVPLMEAFYAGLARGLTVPQALTAARLSLTRDTRYRHPYFWAGSYASGWGRSNLRDLFHDL
jgi:CHAT domain-containing protein